MGFANVMEAFLCEWFPFLPRNRVVKPEQFSENLLTALPYYADLIIVKTFLF